VIDRLKIEKHGIIIILLLYIIVATIVGRSFTTLTPGRDDSQLFAYIGFKWLNGSIPYVDIWDNKPPGIFALIALVFSIFPKSFTALSFMEGFFILGCVGTIYSLLKRVEAPTAVIILSCLSFAVASNLRMYNENGTVTEIYLLLPATLSMFFFMKASPFFYGPWVFAAGICSGIASLFKPVGFSPLLAQVAFISFLSIAHKKLSIRQLFKSTFTNGIGALIVWIPFVLYFWKRNGLWELFNASFFYNINYGASSQILLIKTFNLFIYNIIPLSTLVMFLLAVLGLSYKYLFFNCMKEENQNSSINICNLLILASFWVFFDMLGIIAQGRNYGHYFLCLTPSISLATGAAYWYLMYGREKNYSMDRKTRTIFVLLIVSPLLFFQSQDVYKMARIVRYYKLNNYRKVNNSRWKKVSDKLNMLRKSGDALFVWDYLPGIFFETEMDSPIEQMHAHHIEDSPSSFKYIGQKILNGLREALPTFIVEGEKDTNNKKTTNLVYKKFMEFVEKHYTLIDSVQNLRIYKLKPHESARMKNS
jgi:hypothetical protein